MKRLLFTLLLLIAFPAWGQIPGSGGASGSAGGVLSGTYPNPGFAVSPTLTAPLTLTVPANSSAITSTGYSLTGSNATSLESYTGTINTSGVVDVIKYAISVTAAGGGSSLLNIYGGASGTTSAFKIDVNGNAIMGTTAGLTNGNSTFKLQYGGFGLFLSNVTPIGWGSTGDTTAIDAGVSRIGAAVIGAGNGTNGSLTGQFYGATLRTGQTTVAGLPAAATAGAGARAYVTDATACTFMTAVTGGGATGCPVTSTGAAWVGG